jgi:LPXTG-motif cell wall-anchored protein
VASGVGLNGQPRNLRMDITVAPKAAELAYTGASIAGPAVGGLVALVVGAGLLVASRRRTGH